MKKLQVLTPEIKQQLFENMKLVLDGEIKGFEMDLMCPDVAVKYVEDAYGIDIDLGDNMDTNGWQWDYWIDFRHNDKKFCISGSGYYGDFKFSVDEDDWEGDQ